MHMTAGKLKNSNFLECFGVSLKTVLGLAVPNQCCQARGVCRNFEKGFPLQLNDCYIRVVYIT